MPKSRPGQSGHGACDSTIAKGVETQNCCNDCQLMRPGAFFGRNHGELGDMSGFTNGWYIYKSVNIYIHIHISGYQIIRVNNGLDIHGTNTLWFVAEPPGAPSPVNCRPDTPMPQLPSKNMGPHISPTILPCLL